MEKVYQVLSLKWVHIFVMIMSGIITHAFILLNELINNYDKIFVVNGYGTGLPSGRWALEYIGNSIGYIFGNYNLSYINGLVAIIFWAITSNYLVRLYRIQNVVFQYVIGFLFMVLPVFSATLFFAYTAHYYALSALLSVVAIFMVNKFRYGWLIGAIVASVAIGIYQAYLTLQIALSVLCVIQIVLQGASLKTILKKGMQYILFLVSALVIYLAVLRLSLALSGTQLLSYQGVNEMGKLSIGELPSLILRVFSNGVMMFKTGYYQVFGLPSTKLVMVSIYGVVGVLLLVKVKQGYSYLIKQQKGILFVLLPVFVMAVNSIQLMVNSPNSFIYTIMVPAVYTVVLLPFIVIESLEKNVFSQLVMNKLIRAAVAGMVLVSLQWVYIANVNYKALLMTNHATSAYVNTLVSTIKNHEQFTPDLPIALIGKLEDHTWMTLYQLPDNIRLGGNIAKPENLLNDYSRRELIYLYTGFAYKSASDVAIDRIKETVQFKAMPTYPNSAAVQWIDGVMVVKFSDE